MKKYAFGQSMQTIYVMYVNEELNKVADRGLEAALEYVSKTPQLGMKIELKRDLGNRIETLGRLASLCTTYNKLVNEETPPHVVLDMTMTSYASETVKAFTSSLSIPTITASFGQAGDLRLWRNLQDEEKNYLVQIMPPADVIPEIIRTIVRKQKIANAVILFDDSFVMDHKYKSLLQNIPTRHLITQLHEPTKVKEQLQRLRNLDFVNFFVLGSLFSIKNVLDNADQINFFGKKFAWYAITQNKGDLKANCKNATIIYVKPILDPKSLGHFENIKTSFKLNELDDQPEIASAFYFDLSLRTFLTIRDTLNNGSYLTNYTFLECGDFDGHNTPTRYGLDLRKALKENRSLMPTYGPINVTSNGESQMEFTMQLTAISIREGVNENIKFLGTWKAGLNNELNLVKANAMSNYTADIVYRVVTVLQKPFVMVDENAPKKYSGYCIDLIDKIAEILRFDYEIYTHPDGKFGNMDNDGNWNGIVRELIAKKADIGLGSMSVMAERENVIDFTVPFYDLVGITILMNKPKDPTSLFTFMAVLENEVWLCILALYCFASFLMWVFDRWSPYSYQNNRKKYKNDEEKRVFSVKECLWFCMTSLTPQGGGETPKNVSGCLVAATWWLFGFIIISSYTANLAAFLTVTRLETPIESLDDLAKQYKIQYAPLNGSAAMIYFERMANIEAKFYEIWKDMSLNDSLSPVERSKLAVWDYPVSDKYTKMWQTMKKAGLPNTLEEAVAKVVKSQSSSDGFAYLGDATDIRYLQLTNCDLQMVGEEFSRKPYAIAVQQGSPLKDQFNTAILELLNKRELERLKEKWWNSNPEAKSCVKNEDKTGDGIYIENIGGVFIVIFAGVGLACITLGFEYWWYKYRKGSSKGIDVQEENSDPTKASNIQQTERGLDPDMNVGFRSRQIYPQEIATND
ncbi:ionotropic receptor 25a-like [Chrysoperla carnea]|uniref:ionotropic receptor 25a-like n=1 Tax=Chrysoperla carnea TaxID=189513 RepID=UPI001D064922|nr:ionotropic receptor 25a-like [Chrysoperla carnea]